VRTPFTEAFHDARLWRLRAKAAARQGMETREVSGASSAEANDEAWRRTLLTTDPSRVLSRSLAAARRAASLARTPSEAGRAATLRVPLECDAGHHREELRQAKKLAAIERGSRHSLTILLRAARCNGEDRLARETAAALEAMP
jgi:D-serine deaminase-like pyridoxal phosphate-dependent protein